MYRLINSHQVVGTHKLQRAKEVVNYLKNNRIGHAGYPETSGIYAYVTRYGKRTRGVIVDSNSDGSEFRLRFSRPGYGYEESNYHLDEIEFA